MSPDEEWPDWTLQRWAEHLADVFDERRPQHILSRFGVELHARSETLRVPGRKLLGTWDPVLRRIELFGCTDGRADEELIEVLGHEIWHTLDAWGQRIRRTHARRSPDGEHIASAFARVWSQRLGPERVRTCAAVLRERAQQATSEMRHRTIDGDSGITGIGS